MNSVNMKKDIMNVIFLVISLNKLTYHQIFFVISTKYMSTF